MKEGFNPLTQEKVLVERSTMQITDIPYGEEYRVMIRNLLIESEEG